PRVLVAAALLQRGVEVRQRIGHAARRRVHVREIEIQPLSRDRKLFARRFERVEGERCHGTILRASRFGADSRPPWTRLPRVMPAHRPPTTLAVAPFGPWLRPARVVVPWRPFGFMQWSPCRRRRDWWPPGTATRT